MMFCKAKPVEVWSTGKHSGTLLCVPMEQGQEEEGQKEEIFCIGGLQQILLTKGSTKSGNQPVNSSLFIISLSSYIKI